MGVDPKWVFYLGILVTIELGIGGGSVKLTNAIPEAWQPFVVSWCNILGFIGTSIMTALSGFSSRQAGPLISAPTPPSPGSKTVLGLALVCLLLLMPDHAVAQQKKIGGPIGTALDRIQGGGQPQGSNDGLGTTTSSTGPGGGASLLDKPFQDLANFIGDDIDAAITLSTSIPALQDGNGQQCLMALKTFGQVIKAHPAPLTFKIASDLEAFRLKQMAVNKLCADVHCTQVFADITNTIQAASPIPLPVPSLHDLCSKVPQVAVAPPVASPSPAATTP
jgi:hypothetical protein